MFVCSYRRSQVVNVLPKKKKEIPKGRGGRILDFRKQGGVGVKTWKPSVVGYGYFLELPIVTFVT